MNRRHLLGQTALGMASLGAFVACGSPPTPMVQEDELDRLPAIRWQMATSWPKKLDILFGGAEGFCQQVEAMTNGRFSITPYAAGELVDSFGVLDAVTDGAIACGHTASYYYFDRNPALAFGTTVPFGLMAEQQNSWLYYGGGSEMLNEIYAEFGAIAFPAGNTGSQMGGWFKRQINGVEDLKNLKMRIPGFGSEVMKRLGVDVTVLPADQIVLALLNDEIDAVEWNNPYDDEVIGLNEAAPYYYYPGWWEPGATYHLLVNLEEWQALPREYKEILKVAAANVNLKMLAEYNAKNGKVLQRFMQGGTKVIPFSEEILEAAYKITFDIYEEYSQQDPQFRAIYQQWSLFREQIYQWIQTNEFTFSEFSMKSAGF